MRRVIILFIVLVCILGSTLTYFYWPSIERRIKKLTLNKEQEAKDLQKTRELLNNSKPEEAFEIIQQYADQIDNQTEIGREWLDLLIRASEALQNTSQLVVLYEYYPKSFDSHEKAALLVAETYLNSGRGKDFQVLRDSWKGREANPEAWFVLEADKLLLEGKRKEAVDLLNSRTFTGKADTTRLVRLALINVFENPRAAWDYLTQAQVKDPTNPEIRSYRAKLLETIGKNSLALIEYLAAIQLDPKNLYLRDQLAEFYLRRNQYANAIQIWSDVLPAPSLDFIWLKALFWNKVVVPVKFDWKSNSIPQGKLDSLISYLLSLKPGVFWDSASFEKVANGKQYLKTRQETFWLRIIQLLKDNKEKEAYDLIQFNPFHSISWNLPLENALSTILLYRKTGNFVSAEEQTFKEGTSSNASASLQEEASSTQSAAASTPSKEGSKPAKSPKLRNDVHVYFAELAYYTENPPDEAKGEKIPEPLQALLKGPDAFAAAFLAAEWYESALDLNALSVIPANYPEWVPYDFTQAIRANKGTSAALEFATLQTPTPPMSLITGELLIASGNPDAALEQLLKLTKEQSDVGYRASWLVSLIYIERGQYAEAKTILNGQPKLAAAVVGKETFARIALLEGNTDLATTVYESIEKDSPEAQSFLARKAFLDKDYKKARELTENLLRQYPTNQLLQENLKKIVEELNLKKPTK